MRVIYFLKLKVGAYEKESIESNAKLGLAQSKLSLERHLIWREKSLASRLEKRL